MAERPNDAIIGSCGLHITCQIISTESIFSFKVQSQVDECNYDIVGLGTNYAHICIAHVF